MYIDRFLKRNHYTDSEIPEDLHSLFDLWTQDHPDYIIQYKTSPQSEIITINEPNSKEYYIIWDTSFWDLFTKFFYITDEPNFSPLLDVNTLKENSSYIVALFFMYLSKRYSYYPELSSNFGNISEHFGYSILLDNINGNSRERESYNFDISLCKYFTFWHEIAHAEFHKFDSVTLLYQKYIKLVYETLENLSLYDLSSEIPDWEIISEKIKKHQLAPDLIEELAADLRAIQRMMGLGAIANIRNSLSRFIKSVVVLFEFSHLKLVTDNRWNHYIKRKRGEPPSLIEHQVIRQNLFPLLVYAQFGAQKLGFSILYEIKEQLTNTLLFIKLFDFTLDKSIIKSLLNNPAYIDSDFYHKVALLNAAYQHMSQINADSSSKRLKYLFNLAHEIQHSDHPLDSIPMFYRFINQSQKKQGENERYIGDAYSRMARVYAENGYHIRAKILLNNSIYIANQLPNNDICSAFLFNNIGNVFKHLGEDTSAFLFYYNAMRIHIKLDDTDSLSMAAIYRNLGSCDACGFYQTLKYYLKAYAILKSRYDEDNSDLIDIRKDLKFFSDYPCGIKQISVSTGKLLSVAKEEYEQNRNNIVLLEEYLFCMVHDLLNVPFNEAYRLYIEIIELVETHTTYPPIAKFSLYAFVNFQNSLREELKYPQKHECI